MTLIPQSGSDLGAKMESAFREVFRRGFLVTAIIGSDSPDLPAEYISRAFSLLEKGESDAVFGPSTDGGYYLLAMRQLRAGLFREIPWSSDAVLAMSIARAESANIQVKLLPTWHDIDSAADLRRPDLWREDSPATRTLAFLRNSNRLV
jgi:rSAM/selenodomain-associated transferase 1